MPWKRTLHMRISPDPSRLRLHHDRSLRRDGAQAGADQPTQLLSRTSLPCYRLLASAHLLPTAARYLAMYVIYSRHFCLLLRHTEARKASRWPAGQSGCLRSSACEHGSTMLFQGAAPFRYQVSILMHLFPSCAARLVWEPSHAAGGRHVAT